ncbi:hypothetical protein [Sulfitobacter sp. R18_1]|uniref:hypothetical protein n=1 Tax=Sulfitobacter sp. R18_1 TaxID=2821104 RepID=UPI001ADA954F|nr:hypothetical protein [Sulfitobacter sp. R18_1]MBO9428475.1 hypothetical protein [Sulfitobacter sp. R18_1]
MKNAGIIALSVILSGVGFSAAASDQSCANALRRAGSDLTTNVRVNVSPGQPVYDLSLSQQELTQHSAGMIAISRNSYVNGLTDAYFEDRSRSLVQKLDLPGGGTCVWPSSYELNLQYKRMVVYVANEFKEGSCPYAATMRHELEHVRINNDTFLQHRSDIESRMRRYIEGTFPIRVPRGKNPDDVSNQLLRSASSTFVDRVTDIRDAKHSELDSPESYAYWQSLCHDWSGKH